MLFRSQARARLGSEVNVSVEEVAEIPPEKSGKYRYVVSHVLPAVASEVSRA